MKHQMWHRHYLQPNPNGSYRNLTVPFKHTYKISSLLKKKGRLAASIKLLYMLKYWFDNPHVLPGCLSIARHTQKPFSSGVWLGTKAPANLTPCTISLRDNASSVCLRDLDDPAVLFMLSSFHDLAQSPTSKVNLCWLSGALALDYRVISVQLPRDRAGP